jgi:hypothetical protein
MMDWWQSYAAKNYALAGEIDILQGVPTAYFWDQQMTNRTSLDPAVIYVFRRN